MCKCYLEDITVDDIGEMRPQPGGERRRQRVRGPRQARAQRRQRPAQGTRHAQRQLLHHHQAVPSGGRGVCCTSFKSYI